MNQDRKIFKLCLTGQWFTIQLGMELFVNNYDQMMNHTLYLYMRHVCVLIPMMDWQKMSYSYFKSISMDAIAN